MPTSLVSGLLTWTSQQFVNDALLCCLCDLSLSGLSLQNRWHCIFQHTTNEVFGKEMARTNLRILIINGWVLQTNYPKKVVISHFINHYNDLL